MRLRRISLQHFRNIAFADLELSGRQQFLVGGNGQGKTALLEAAGFITALRSFRASDSRLMIAHEQAEAAVVMRLEHEQFGETVVSAKLRKDGKDVQVDGERVQRLGDYLGKFPTVVFSSQDQQLVRGAPAGRRRWLDLTLAATDATYLAALQTYARALAERNGLLKRGNPAAAELAAFEQVLAPAAARLIELRSAGLKVLGDVLTAAYAEISAATEPAVFQYVPDFAEATTEAILAMLEKYRARDAQFRTTLTGPHRDDFAFMLKGHAAKDSASEGQQRSLVLALRLAQARWFQEKRGVKPVLLADDVLGELDPARRRRFWAALDPELQVIATGTSLPDADLGTWQVFNVASGVFSAAESGL